MPINRKHSHIVLLSVALLFFNAAVSSFAAERIVLQLRNGDRFTGELISQDAKQIVIRTPWIKELAVPLVEVTNRLSLSISNQPSSTVVAEKTGQTNAVSGALTGTPVKAVPKLARADSWHGKIDIGADLGFSEVSRELYYGRAKITYAPQLTPGQPRSVADRFKNTFDYQATYGRNDGVVSANRMDGASKTDFDIGKRIFIYNVIGAGYDEIRQINYQYEVGPGVGYRVFMRTNFVLNAETGFNYQMQNLEAGTTDTSNERFSIRLAEDATWSISKKLTLDEKLEIFPSLGDGFRLRFESNLRYALWQGGSGQSLFLALTVLDLYDTQLTTGVSANDLQIRSSIGISF